jgi:hypothetical protein
MNVAEKLPQSRLTALAIKTEDRNVRMFFADDEKSEMSKEHTSKMIEIAAAEEQFEQVKLIHRENIAPIKRASNDLLRNIRNGYVDVMTKCYLIDDQEKGVMQYFNEAGVMVDERRLYPEERQLTLKTGSAE